MMHDAEKSSLLDYADKGVISFKASRIFDFSGDKTHSEYTHENENFGETECFSVKFDRDEFQAEALYTDDDAFSFGIADRRRETVKILAYINDIDLLECDHDMVYKDPQKNFGTLWIVFGKSRDSKYKYSIQHTFKSSGWHMLEISFNTDNIIYEDRCNLDYSEFHYMQIRANVKGGLEMKFAFFDKFSFDNPGYVMPKCPRGGKWLSTCDCESLDGTVLTEWMNSSFDFENKTQGSSSVSITGHKEHVDYRCVWGGLDVPLERENDIFHMDMYIDSLDRVGDDFICRLSQSEGGPGSAVYSFDYRILQKFSNFGGGLKDGWNEVDVPACEMIESIDKNYFSEPFEYRIEHIVCFWAGASADLDYTVKYDNMYIYGKDSAE